MLQAERQVVFEVRAGASHFALRMYPPRTGDSRVLRSQCLWLRALNRDKRLSLPRPVSTDADEDVIVVRSGNVSWRCTLMRWVEGRPRLRPDGPRQNVLRQVGRLMAKLHTHGQTFKPPPTFRCPRWDWHGLFSDSSPWRPVRPLRVDRRTKRLFDHVIDRTRAAMDDLGYGPDVFGLIHGDLIQVNYVVHKNRVGAIDFSDFGRGHFLYDMAITLLMLKPFDAQGRQRAAFIQGYREIRPLITPHTELLDLFVAARAVALARWILGSSSHEKSGLRWATTTIAWLNKTF
jgi:Ser/Thr protein kinase RdoA (MazF antagonist)